MFDSSPLITLFDDNDMRKGSVVETLENMQQLGWPFCISEHIIAETHNRVRQDISANRALEFLEKTHSDIDSGSINLLVPETGDRDSAISIISKYSDQSLSYADALTMAMMKRIGIRKILTFDWHFTLLGFLPVPPLPP